jgi:hypothetical protein
MKEGFDSQQFLKMLTHKPGVYRMLDALKSIPDYQSLTWACILPIWAPLRSPVGAVVEHRPLADSKTLSS